MDVFNLKLGNILNQRLDKPDEFEIMTGRVKIISKISFNDGKIELRPDTFTNTQMILVKPGDLVISGINVMKGAVAIYSEKETESLAATIHYSSYEINEKYIDRKYLWYLLRSKFLQNYIRTNTANGIKNEIRPNFFLNINFSCPSLKTQKKIVQEIELFLIDINDIIQKKEDQLNSIEEIIPKKLESLLGNPDKKLDGLFGDIKFDQLEKYVIDVADGPHITPNYVTEGIPFITVKNIISGKIDFSNVDYITYDDHKLFENRAKAEKGDVLLSKDGTIGIPCFINNDYRFSYFVSVALIKPNNNLLNGEYLTWILKTPYIQNKIKQNSRGDMIRHLVLREIRKLQIPLISLPNQIELSCYFNILQQKIDELVKIQKRQIILLTDFKRIYIETKMKQFD